MNVRPNHLQVYNCCNNTLWAWREMVIHDWRSNPMDPPIILHFQVINPCQIGAAMLEGGWGIQPHLSQHSSEILHERDKNVGCESLVLQCLDVLYFGRTQFAHNGWLILLQTSNLIKKKCPMLQNYKQKNPLGNHTQSTSTLMYLVTCYVQHKKMTSQFVTFVSSLSNVSFMPAFGYGPSMVQCQWTLLWHPANEKKQSTRNAGLELMWVSHFDEVYPALHNFFETR